MSNPTNWIKANTTDAKPLGLYFSNFGYWSNKGPFATEAEAKEAARSAGFDAALYNRDGCYLVATYSAISGWTRR